MNNTHTIRQYIEQIIVEQIGMKKLLKVQEVTFLGWIFHVMN